MERAIGANWGTAVFYDIGNALIILIAGFCPGCRLGHSLLHAGGPIRLDIAANWVFSIRDNRFHFTWSAVLKRRSIIVSSVLSFALLAMAVIAWLSAPVRYAPRSGNLFRWMRDG